MLNGYLVCPECKSANIGVVDSRVRSNQAVYRRRRCDACGHRWSTHETPAQTVAGVHDFTELLRALADSLGDASSCEQIRSLTEAVRRHGVGELL